jgi:Tfp pilus assembly protein PilZ
MTENSENRHAPRFAHNSPLQVKDLKTGQIYEARMFNFSQSGIYFESDIVFHKGSSIYICIQNSPYSLSSGVLEYYNGKIMWRKNLKRSFFSYGYGIQLASDSNKQNLDSKSTKNTKDSRRHPRKPFFRTVQFGNHTGFFKGSTKNISASGVFIATEEKLKVGQVIKLDLPMKGKAAKIIGQIAWLNEEGFGLKFKKID